MVSDTEGNNKNMHVRGTVHGILSITSRMITRLVREAAIRDYVDVMNDDARQSAVYHPSHAPTNIGNWLFVFSLLQHFMVLRIEQNSRKRPHEQCHIKGGFAANETNTQISN